MALNIIKIEDIQDATGRMECMNTSFGRLVFTFIGIDLASGNSESVKHTGFSDPSAPLPTTWTPL